MKIIDCLQGSVEWRQARCGVPTASCFDKIVTSKGTSSKQVDKYMFQLAGEIISGSPEEAYKNDAMERGTLLEDEARTVYKVSINKNVSEIGFCLADGDIRYGASPDGMVDEDGLIQIKCPKLSTHVEYLLTNALPIDYFQQVQGEMLVTDRKWNDFVSYYPGMELFVKRVERDEEFIDLLKEQLAVFQRDLNDIVKKLSYNLPEKKVKEF